MKRLAIFLVSLFFLILFTGCKNEFEETTLLIIGDVQLQSDLQKYYPEDWKQQSLDASIVHEKLREVILREQPDYILQTGDWVNYNNALHLSVVDTNGIEIETLPLPYDEWEVMNQIIPKEKKSSFFPVQGNHESYGYVELAGVFLPGFDVLADIDQKEFTLLTAEQRRTQLIKQFPHIQEWTLDSVSASYFTSAPTFGLLSFDGISPDRSSLLRFIKKALESFDPSKLIIVSSHYPLFTGRDIKRQYEMTDIYGDLVGMFEEHGVDFYFNGHEHFYLRYSGQGKRNYFPDVQSNFEAITVSDFFNPYSRTSEVGQQLKEGEGAYFEGPHYSTLTIRPEKVELRSYGFRTESQSWTVIETVNRSIEN